MQEEYWEFENQDEEDFIWRKEYPCGLVAEFEERREPGTGEVREYALTFSDEEGCCLSLPDAPGDDIFFADTKDEIEAIADKKAIELQKAKAAGLR